jgi:acyl carrier protein
MAMTREDVLEVVKKHAMDTIEDLEEGALDNANSLVEVGANSLDVVEIVSLSMRELKVKVPREELMKVESFDGLIDLLYSAVQEREANA